MVMLVHIRCAQRLVVLLSEIPPSEIAFSEFCPLTALRRQKIDCSPMFVTPSPSELVSRLSDSCDISRKVLKLSNQKLFPLDSS